MSLRSLAAEFRYSAQERQELAGELYRANTETYLATLEDLADEYGYSVENIQLSEEVEDALYASSVDHARQVTDTYNREVTAFFARLPKGTSDSDAEDAFEKWLDDRQEWKPRQIALTEAYTAHADATMSFFDALGVEVAFDFGGHGDAAPACEICAALVATNPHPKSRVLAIGIPHPQCAQKWHPRELDRDSLPDEATFGQSTAGLTDSDLLTNNTDSRAGAAQRVRDLADER